MHQLIEAWRCKKCAGGLYVRHAVTTDIHVQITNHKFAAIPRRITWSIVKGSTVPA